MKREFLQNLKVNDQPLPKEVIDAIMAENGRDIEAADNTLGEKIKKFFRDICDLLKRTIQAYSHVKPDSEEGRMVQGMQDIYDQLQQVFAEGVYEGGDNYRRAEKNTSSPSGSALSTSFTISCLSASVQ